MPSGPRPQPPVNTCKFVVSGDIFGIHSWVNIFYLKLTSAGAPNAGDLGNVIDAAAAAFNTRIAPLMTSSWETQTFEGTWLTTGGGAISVTKNHNYTGGGGAALQDAAASYLIDWNINAYYRGGHPRTYLASVQTAHVTSGSLINSTAVSNLATGANGWLSDVNALTHGDITGTALGTVSFQTAKNWRVPPIFRAYQSASVRNLLATQRRRIGGR